MTLVKTCKINRLKVKIFENRQSLGHTAGKEVAQKMRELLEQKDRIRMIFAAAPSQNEFLQALTEAESVDWSRVTAFHMDEYIGLAADAPQRFSRFLKERLFDIVHPGQVHLIQCEGAAVEECRRYAALVSEGPVEIVCMGIGENGHIAFNDPPVADFRDPAAVKPVKLDDACRQQQVNDGCFPHFDAVPTHAVTLTIPTLLSGAHLFCMVPGATKRAAVTQTLTGPVTTECPSSILREHPDCTLYADTDSYGEKL